MDNIETNLVDHQQSLFDILDKFFFFYLNLKYLVHPLKVYQP